MPFTPPKGTAFKQFVILDAEGNLASLSAIDGGQVDEILTRSGEEHGGEAGGDLRVGPAKAGGKRARTRKTEEEIRRAQTRHSTAAKLLEALHAQESIGVVDGPFDSEVAAQVSPGMVLQFRAVLRLHPLHHMDQMLRSFIEIAPTFGEKQTAAELKQVQTIWRSLIGTLAGKERLLLEPVTIEPQAPRLLIPIPTKDLEVELEAMLGEVTMVAQVERLIAEGDEPYAVMRYLRGAPANNALEREMLDEGLPDLIEALVPMGIEISTDDIFIPGPALVLRSICAYR